MTPEDRELLEAAAKAAGIVNLRWGIDEPELQITGKGQFVGATWNPLTSDGDRYRLAQRLGLAIDFADCTVWKRLPDHSLIQEYWGGESGDEAHAIVRAAAEIGRSMT